MERQSKGWERQPAPRAAQPRFRSWRAECWACVPGLRSRGSRQHAASSSHWHDFLGSRARKDLKTELQPANKFQLCLWEEALLAWPLVPCPYTFRRREQLRWMHIPGLSSWPASAAMLWMGKLGAGRWAGNPCRSRCTSSVFVCVLREFKSEEPQRSGEAASRAGNAKWDRAGQQGQPDLGQVERGRKQHLLLDAEVHWCKACRLSKETKARRSQQHSNAQRPVTTTHARIGIGIGIDFGTGIGTGCATPTHLHAALHHHSHHSLWRWESERNSGSKSSHIHAGIWQCVCLAVTQFVKFFLTQYQGTTDWKPRIRVVRAEEENSIMLHEADVASPKHCWEKPWMRERMLRHVQGAGWMPALEQAEHPCSLRGVAALLQQPDTEPWFSWQGFRLASLAMSFGFRQCSQGCRNHLQYSLKFASMFRKAQQLHHVKAF